MSLLMSDPLQNSSGTSPCSGHQRSSASNQGNGNASAGAGPSVCSGSQFSDILSLVSGSGIPASISESGAQMENLDNNLVALCGHVQLEGWNSQAFSDIVVRAMGSTFHLHRLLLSRSSFFRHMLQGPWTEANAKEVTLHVDDENINPEAIATALAYLYGHTPKLDDSNACRVLAAASFLDLQDLCAFCTDFIISELWTQNFLAYQAFAESQDYGVYGERVRKACWGYLCRGAAVELREILPKLSTHTLLTLLTSDELWVPNEEKRFELALSVLIAKGVVIEINPRGSSSSSCFSKDLFREGSSGNNKENAAVLDRSSDVTNAMNNIVLELADTVAATYLEPESSTSSSLDKRYTTDSQHRYGGEARKQASAAAHLEDLSNSHQTFHSCYEDNCRYGDPPGQCSPSSEQGTTTKYSGHWNRDGSWGGRVVGRRHMKVYRSQDDWTNNEDWDSFIDIFEGGGIHYCHMAFEELLDTRARLEELGFPCRSVADGLWLQTLLRKQVLAIAADTCKNCSLSIPSCICRHLYVYPAHSRANANSYRDDQERIASVVAGNFSLPDGQSSTGVQTRVHPRNTLDGLAGIGRGTAGQSGTSWWPSSRLVFPRVHGAKSNQQSLGNDHTSDLGVMDLPSSVDGLNAVVGLTQGISGVSVQSDQTGRIDEQGYFPNGETLQNKLDAQESSSEQEWDACQGMSISLDLHTPLRSFPPFRFGVEFEDVYRLGEGQHTKHSQEFFYAGSLWKISLQAFNDEDPRYRRTLGLFLHRRKADESCLHGKVSLYSDTREKVTARYQLICPAKRGLILGSLTQAGTLLPKAPKGWGWRTAFVFDELVDLLQGSSLRVAAVVQLV